MIYPRSKIHDNMRRTPHLTLPITKISHISTVCNVCAVARPAAGLRHPWVPRFMAAVLAVLAAVCGARAQSVDSLMQVLDEALLHRDSYIATQDSVIQQLRNRVVLAADDDERFEALGHLFDSYRSFQADSALVMAARREALARKIGSAEKLVHARLNTANILSMTGSYTEAVEILDGIRSADLPDYLVPYFYHVKRLLYGNLADYAIRPDDRARYQGLTGAYRDSLLTVNDPDGWAYALIVGDRFNSRGEYRKGVETMQGYIRDHNLSEHEQAVFAYTLSESYRQLKDRRNEKRYLLISAIGDIKSGVREYVSLRKLAMLLYSDGDIERAHRLMQVCIDDATSSNSRQRIIEINEVFPLVNQMYLSEIRNQQKRLQIALWAITVLFVFLVAGAVSLYKNMHRARRATASANRATDELRQLNEKLHQINEQLHEANAAIAEHSSLKTEYIGRYMDQTLQNIDALSAYRKLLRKLLATGNIEKVGKTLDSDAVIDDMLQSFYNGFDQTFLKLFPTFIEDFNALLEPSGRTVPRSPGTLNTELRIYALIRLGITDSTKIAKFLRYSVTTIYNYRTKVRNKALGNRDELESLVANIGK